MHDKSNICQILSKSVRKLIANISAWFSRTYAYLVHKSPLDMFFAISRAKLENYLLMPCRFCFQGIKPSITYFLLFFLQPCFTKPSNNVMICLGGGGGDGGCDLFYPKSYECFFYFIPMKSGKELSNCIPGV